MRRRETRCPDILAVFLLLLSKGSRRSVPASASVVDAENVRELGPHPQLSLGCTYDFQSNTDPLDF